MNLLEKNITISIGNKHIVSNSELKIIPKEKYGLIGKNGGGKTTLLNYIYNQYHKDISIFLVNQEFNFDSTKLFMILSLMPISKK